MNRLYPLFLVLFSLILSSAPSLSSAASGPEPEPGNDTSDGAEICAAPGSITGRTISDFSDQDWYFITKPRCHRVTIKIVHNGDPLEFINLVLANNVDLFTVADITSVPVPGGTTLVQLVTPPSLDSETSFYLRVEGNDNTAVNYTIEMTTFDANRRIKNQIVNRQNQIKKLRKRLRKANSAALRKRLVKNVRARQRVLGNLQRQLCR